LESKSKSRSTFRGGKDFKMNSIRQIQALNKRELENCVSPSASWHTDYRDTAYIFIGGLPFDLTEGDIVTIFSQFGEPVWLKLARDKETGKSKGFAWLKYEDQRSTDLAVDNLGGATILDRIIKVDHARYKKKDDEANEDEFNVAFEESEPERESKRSRHRRKYHRSRNDSKEKSRISHDDSLKAIKNRDDSDEDPMKDYISREKKQDHQRRRSRERRRSRNRHHKDSDDDTRRRRHRRERSLS
jgi:RNA-binding motif protein, X-linked 2